MTAATILNFAKIATIITNIDLLHNHWEYDDHDVEHLRSMWNNRSTIFNLAGLASVLDENQTCVVMYETLLCLLCRSCLTTYIYRPLTIYFIEIESVTWNEWWGVFLCVQFNSAADEYVLRHLDKFFSSRGNASRGLLRVYDVDRRIATVDTAVLKYCLLSKDSQRFLAPTETDIKQRGVVITTLVTSLVLSELNIKGYFTHIFIDEAAQVCNSPRQHQRSSRLSSVTLTRSVPNVSNRVPGTQQ